jgi:RHS repeat-associated protein
MTVNSQGITYKINGLGQRVSEAFSGSTTHYIDDINGNVIAEADGSTGTPTMEYVWMEGELLALIDGSGNIVYVHNSQVRAPQKITNPSRTLVFDQIREPFGEVYSTPTGATPTNWRFPGQYANANNSLSHNGARDYDSSGPFYVESDPMGLAGGLNPVAYAGQNPTEITDSAGLCPGDKQKCMQRFLLDNFGPTGLNLVSELSLGNFFGPNGPSFAWESAKLFGEKTTIVYGGGYAGQWIQQFGTSLGISRIVGTGRFLSSVSDAGLGLFTLVGGGGAFATAADFAAWVACTNADVPPEAPYAPGGWESIP